MRQHVAHTPGLPPRPKGGCGPRPLPGSARPRVPAPSWVPGGSVLAPEGHAAWQGVPGRRPLPRQGLASPQTPRAAGWCSVSMHAVRGRVATSPSLKRFGSRRFAGRPYFPGDGPWRRRRFAGTRARGLVGACLAVAAGQGADALRAVVLVVAGHGACDPAQGLSRSGGVPEWAYLVAHGHAPIMVDADKHVLSEVAGMIEKLEAVGLAVGGRRTQRASGLAGSRARAASLGGHDGAAVPFGGRASAPSGSRAPRVARRQTLLPAARAHSGMGPRVAGSFRGCSQAGTR